MAEAMTTTEAIKLIVRQFKTGQRADYARLRALLVAGLVSEADVREIEKSVVGKHVAGQIVAGRWVEEVVI